MTGSEAGFLLLTSHLGDPERKVLSVAQMRILATRVQMAEKDDPDRDLRQEDLVAMGYGREMAKRMLALLGEEQRLTHYCRRGEKRGCFPLTRASAHYPEELQKALGEETPGCLWYKGNLTMLAQPKVALVGSRDIREENREFAKEVGIQAAKQGYVLVSGNARGADQTAQQACLKAGGNVICVVADSLEEKKTSDHVLYLSEDVYDFPFSAQRAISRNRVIHALGQVVFVAQCGYQQGGTWDGTAKNLHHEWSRVFCFEDGSPASQMLQQMGALPIGISQLKRMSQLPRHDTGFLLDR